MSTDTRNARHETILALREHGNTLQEIGDHVGLTRERVRQILAADGLKTLSNADRINRVAEAWRTSGVLSRPSDVIDEYGLVDSPATRAKLRRAVPELTLPEEKGNRSPWTAEAIVKVIQRVAADRGIDPATGWIRLSDYEVWRRPGDPATATISSNHLWSDVMRGAGFDPRHAGKRGRQPGIGYKAFTDEDIDAAVREYVNSHPAKISAAGMDMFLAAREDLPSGATIRNRYRKRGITSLSVILTTAMASSPE